MRPTHEDPYMGPLPRAAGCYCHVCRPEPSYQPYDRATIDTVLRHGWQVVTVGADGVTAATTRVPTRTTTTLRPSPTPWASVTGRVIPSS